MGDIGHVLFTSSGRRSYLLEYFREVLGSGATISATDCDPLAPVFESCDNRFVVPRIDDEEYTTTIKRICDRFDVDLLVSLNDRELSLFAAERESYREIGTHVLVSSEDVIDIANDKLRTYRFLSENDVPTPFTTADEAEFEAAFDAGRIEYPVIVKPRFGSGSQNIHIAHDERELDVFWQRLDRPIVQERLDGQEFGVDVFNGEDSTPKSIVPRKKIETRAGETDKAVSVDDPALLKVGRAVGDALGHHGPIDIDCFRTDEEVFVLELNARFGGGYPLTHLAGGGFVEAALALATGQGPEDRLGEFEAGVHMTKAYEIFSPDPDQRELYRFD